MLSIKNNIIYLGDKKDGKFIKLEDVRVIRAYMRGVKIITADIDVSCSLTLTSIKQALDNPDFFEVCRGCLVNTSYIEMIKGDYLVLKNITENIHISRRRKRELLKWIQTGRVVQ